MSRLQTVFRCMSKSCILICISVHSFPPSRVTVAMWPAWILVAMPNTLHLPQMTVPSGFGALKTSLTEITSACGPTLSLTTPHSSASAQTVGTFGLIIYHAQFMSLTYFVMLNLPVQVFCYSFKPLLLLTGWFLSLERLSLGCLMERPFESIRWLKKMMGHSISKLLRGISLKNTRGSLSTSESQRQVSGLHELNPSELY